MTSIMLSPVQWMLVNKTPKTCDNHRQRDKQTEFINRVKREHMRPMRWLVSLRKLSTAQLRQ